jgi:hypothetical protein
MQAEFFRQGSPHVRERKTVSVTQVMTALNCNPSVFLFFFKGKKVSIIIDDDGAKTLP